MMASPTTLLGSSLVFDRTGQTLIAVEPDAISVIELGAGGQTTRLPIREARTVAAFADQLWIATHDDQLARLDHAGRPLAPTRSLPFAARAMLQPAPCGPNAAVWSSSPALALIDDFGQLTASDLADVELALPLTGRRFVTVRGAKLTLPSGLVTTLPPNTTVLGGAVMADGKSVTLLAAHRGGRQLIVVSLGTGQITQRCAILSSTVRLAIRRGLVIVQLESRVLRLLDLHAGRELGTLRFDHDVDDFVVDLDGHRLAVRAGHGAIELHQLVDLLRRPAASIQAPAESELPGTIPKDPTVEPDVITSAPRGEQPGSEASEDDRIARLMRRVAADIRGTRTIVSGGPEAIVRARDPGLDPLPPRATAELRCLLVCPALTALDPRPRPVEIDRVLARHQLGRELRHPGPILVIASPDETVPFGPGHLSIELPVLAETDRRAVWTRALDEASLAVADVDALAARYKIGPGVIRRAVAAARDAARTTDGDASPGIEAYIRQTRDTRLGQYARRVARLASWSSVVFPPDILDSLRELVARVRHGRQVYETWGMNRTMATSRGLTALFQGQPGTGKTLVAGVIARELGLDLYQVDLSKVMSKWIGETERNLATIFDAAEDGQVILLFDEADSLFAKRTEVRSRNDRYANLEVNYLLQRLDSFEGIAILTTNSGNSIDQAFKRRLSFRLSFPFPDEETREQLWRAHLPPELPTTGPLTLDTLARKYQLSGGYIRNACLRAAFLAAQDETSLHQHHLERAVALEFAELGKLSHSGAID